MFADGQTNIFVYFFMLVCLITTEKPSIELVETPLLVGNVEDYAELNRNYSTLFVLRVLSKARPSLQTSNSAPFCEVFLAIRGTSCSIIIMIKVYKIDEKNVQRNSKIMMKTIASSTAIVLKDARKRRFIEGYSCLTPFSLSIPWAIIKLSPKNMWLYDACNGLCQGLRSRWELTKLDRLFDILLLPRFYENKEPLFRLS
jgi:hypothetical protein